MILRSRYTTLLLAAFCLQAPAMAVSPDPISTLHTQADLDAMIASTADAPFKQALRDNAPALLAAAEQHAHVEAVIRAIESDPGKFEKINTTPDALKKAAGHELTIFDTLKLVDLAIPNAGPHDRRQVDPFDAAFFEHLGHLSQLESLNIISTKASDDWIAPLGKLTNLKTLRFTNNGKLTDAGLEHLAGLRQLESFSFVGTGMKGHAFAKFDGWTKLTKSSFRGSSIDDEGLQLLCEKFPNYESLSLAHAKFTDAGAPSLARLTKLKGLEIGTQKASAKSLGYLIKLPLEYLQLGEGFDSAEAIALIKPIATLRRLTLTSAKALTDADLQIVASMTQLEALEMNNLDLPDARLPQLKGFAFLKSLRLVKRPQAYPPETQAHIKALLPKVAVTFE